MSAGLNTPAVSTKSDRVFHYHADANPFGGIMNGASGPSAIPTQGSASLSESGGHAEANGSAYSEATGQISIGKSWSEIDGWQDKVSGDWVTVVTSCVEDLDIANRIEAKKITCKMTTVHPSSAAAYYPSIAFSDCEYGTLRVDGQNIVPTVDMTCYARSAADVAASPGSWMQDIDLLAKVRKQMSVFSGTSVSSPLNSRYNWVTCANDRNAKGHLVCSLVQGFSGAQSPMKSFGHVLVVPGFGNLFFAELRVYHCSFSLCMLRAEIDTAAPPKKKSGLQATVGFASAHTNASSSP